MATTASGALAGAPKNDMLGAEGYLRIETVRKEFDGFVAVDDVSLSIRKGEVWVLDGVLDAKPTKVSYKLFASGLHEPLGLLRDGKDLLVTQRTETTRLRDSNGDGVADE